MKPASTSRDMRGPRPSLASRAPSLLQPHLAWPIMAALAFLALAAVIATGHHFTFDRTLIQRYSAAHLGRRPSNLWIDLEHVVRLVVPGLPSRSLDAAMERLGVRCLQRHQAAADALATAEVLLRIWDRARAEMGGRTDVAAFRRLAGRHHWL